jgi:hypothetical protein
MSDARLQAELTVAKAEILRLQESLSPGTSGTPAPIVRKVLSLISLVPKWAGTESGIPLEEFFASIEGSSKIGKWDERQAENSSFKVDGSSPVIL